MSEDMIPSFTAADGTEAATPAEGALIVHAVEGCTERARRNAILRWLRKLDN